MVTDQVGNVVSRTDFGAFGEETVTPQRTVGLGYKADNVRQDYTGYEKDDESGLEYAQARYYNPAHGRFTSVDPLTASASIRNPQTFNRYSYVLNSPYKFTDPLGLISQSTGACGQCGKEEVGGGGGAFNSAAGIFDVYYLVTQTTTFSTQLISGNNQATITLSITEQWIEGRNGNRIGSYSPDPVVNASLSNVRGFDSTQQEQIKTIVETGARSALKLGVSVAAFMGILQQETQFGMFQTSEGPRKNSVSNPAQFSSGRAQIADWRSAEYQAVLEYNIEQSIIQVYYWAARRAVDKSGNRLWWTFYYWNGNSTIGKNGLEQRVDFANKALDFANRIQASMSVRRERHVFSSFGTPNAPPTRGLRRCEPISLIPC